jgi:serine/threonine protein kinase
VEPLKPADPTELGGIALRGRLGRGGMGTVYYGVTPDGEQVAVKMIREDLLDQSEILGRFDREAIAIGMVQGPRVANLIATSGPEEAPPWFAVEYVRGLTLAEYVTEHGPLTAALGSQAGEHHPRPGRPARHRRRPGRPDTGARLAAATTLQAPGQHSNGDR